MRLRISPPAEARYRTVDKWWRNNRDRAPELFADEVEAALELLLHSPDMGVEYKRHRRRGLIRRVLLEQSEQYLYYRVLADEQVVEVITIWGARRRRGPRL